MESYIKGNVRRIIYSSDTGYMVGVLKVNEKSDDLDFGNTAPFTGYFHELNYDDNYMFYGEVCSFHRKTQ